MTGIEHNHIDQRARRPEDCARCGALWETLEVVQPHYDLEYGLETATLYYADYGEKEMLEHLTSLREKAQMIKWQIDRSKNDQLH